MPALSLYEKASFSFVHQDTAIFHSSILLQNSGSVRLHWVNSRFQVNSELDWHLDSVCHSRTLTLLFWSHSCAAVAFYLGSLCCWKKKSSLTSQFSSENSSRISMYFVAFMLTSFSHKSSRACCREASSQHDAVTTILSCWGCCVYDGVQWNMEFNPSFRLKSYNFLRQSF